MPPSRIDPIDVLGPDEDDIEALLALRALVEDEHYPSDPPIPLEELRGDDRRLPSWEEHRWWVAWDQGRKRPDGFVHLGLNRTDENRHIASVDIGVRPEVRRQGVATALYSAVADVARSEGCTLVEVAAAVGGDGDAALRKAGHAPRQIERESRLVLDDVPDALLDGWISRAARRAAGYSLVGWDGYCPEELVEPFAHLCEVMNTAPLDDLEHEDDRVTPEQVREADDRAVRAGFPRWILCARCDEDGALAGYTEVILSDHRPWLAYQGDTGVEIVHRNLGLGRWLKAAMVRRLRDERPQVRWIDTWNATTNDAMLAINVALSYRPLVGWAVYQLPLARADGETIA